MFTHQLNAVLWQCSYAIGKDIIRGAPHADFATAHRSLLTAIADRIVFTDPWKMGKEQP